MLGIELKLSDTSVSSLCSSLNEFLSREYASDMDSRETQMHQKALTQFKQLKTDVDLMRVRPLLSLAMCCCVILRN
ncbi:hypothetical protein DD237_001279 [Peronospora effusa]|uniref:Uncharacterized protein n=1 Tax=Peronospora effusa TaxID=542832 RepID=A0A3R7YBJ6_9STRA|nr:hypothetical protein DD237_001279 [Peronospora effusa]